MFFGILPIGPLYRIEVIPALFIPLPIFLFFNGKLCRLSDTTDAHWYENMVGESSGEANVVKSEALSYVAFISLYPAGFCRAV